MVRLSSIVERSYLGRNVSSANLEVYLKKAKSGSVVSESGSIVDTKVNQHSLRLARLRIVYRKVHLRG